MMMMSLENLALVLVVNEKEFLSSVSLSSREPANGAHTALNAASTGSCGVGDTLVINSFPLIARAEAMFSNTLMFESAAF